MLKFVLVIVLLLDSGNILVDKIEHTQLKDCATEEMVLSNAFEKNDQIIQFFTACLPFKKLEKS